MKIHFLGTSAGWPLPRLGCECEICASPDPKDKRLRPSLLINESTLIDCGPDIYHQLYSLPNSQFQITNLKALLITHPHYDHILGFHDLTHLYNLTNQPRLFVTASTLRGLCEFHKYPLDPFKLEIVSENTNFEIENCKYSYTTHILKVD